MRDQLIALARRSGLLSLAKTVRRVWSPSDRARQHEERCDYERLKQEVADAYRSPIISTRRGVKRVLVLGMSRVRDVALQAVLLKGFELAGYRPVVLLPDGNDVKDAYELFGVRDFLRWSRWYPLIKKAQPRSAPTDGFEQVLGIEVDGVAVGRYAASTMMRKTRCGNLDVTKPEIRRELGRHLSFSFDSLIAARRILDHVRPDAALFLDQGYSPSGELFSECLHREIPAILWSAAHRNNRLMLKRYSVANKDVHFSTLSDGSWVTVKQMSWSSAHWEAVSSEIEDCYRSGEWYAEGGTQFKKDVVTKEVIYRTLELDRAKKTAVIFPHIFWDATFFWGTNVFPDYERWLVEVTRAACKNDRLNWIIKIHPANVTKNHRDGIVGAPSELESVRKYIGTLPPHVKVLPPESPISTYSLFGMMDYCLTVRGTIGIEAACFGVPVLTAGTGRYDGLGFTHDTTNSEDYLRRLGNLEAVEPLSSQQVELARRFTYGLLLCRPLLLRSVTMEYQQDPCASLRVQHHIRSRDELAKALDVIQVSDWIQAGNEDFFQLPVMERD